MAARLLCRHDLISETDEARPEEEYLTLESLLRVYPWQHVQKSVWLIELDGSAEVVAHQLEPALQPQDRLFIAPLAADGVCLNPLESAS